MLEFVEKVTVQILDLPNMPCGSVDVPRYPETELQGILQGLILPGNRLICIQQGPPEIKDGESGLHWPWTSRAFGTSELGTGTTRNINKKGPTKGTTGPTMTKTTGRTARLATANRPEPGTAAVTITITASAVKVAMAKVHMMTGNLPAAVISQIAGRILHGE